MKKIILLSVMSLVSLISSAQCNAQFWWIYAGSTAQPINASTGMNAYLWNFGDGTTSTDTNPTHTYAYPGIYTICLYGSYIDSIGITCEDSMCLEVLIPQDTTGNGCVISTSTSVIGSQIDVTNNTTGASSYFWTVSDYNSGVTLTTATTTNLSYNANNSGIYLICLEALDSTGFVCDTLCDTVTVQQPSSCTVGMNSYTIAPNITGYMTNNTGAATISWTISNNATGAIVATSTTTNVTYFATYPGDFLICLTGYDVNGFVCDTICELVAMPQDSLDSNVSLSTFEFLQFQLYPNPTNAVLNIQFDHLPSNAHAHIVDLLGREMIVVELTTELTKVDVMDFPSGMYIVQLLDSNQQLIGMHRFLRE